MNIFSPCQMVLDRTKYQGPFGVDGMSCCYKSLMDVLDRTKCLPAQDSSQPREQQWAPLRTNWPWGLRKGAGELVEMEIPWCRDDPQEGEA